MVEGPLHRFFQVLVHGIGSHSWPHLRVWENEVEGGLLRLLRVAQVHPEVVPRNRAGVWKRN